MNKKIIIIGMDNTGKTTLVNDIKSILNVNSIKSSGPGLTRAQMYEEVIKNLSGEEYLVLERFPIIEELVYGKTLRNNPKFKFQDLIYIKEKYHPLFIYCRPRKIDVYNFGEREQMEGVIEKSKLLLEAFDNLYSDMMKEDFNIIRYDFNINTPSEIVNIYERSKENEYYSC